MGKTVPSSWLDGQMQWPVIIFLFGVVLYASFPNESPIPSIVLKYWHWFDWTALSHEGTVPKNVHWLIGMMLWFFAVIHGASQLTIRSWTWTWDRMPTWIRYSDSTYNNQQNSSWSTESVKVTPDLPPFTSNVQTNTGPGSTSTNVLKIRLSESCSKFYCHQLGGKQK